jgi:two-component system sensor histidine kinase UhpB
MRLDAAMAVRDLPAALREQLRSIRGQAARTLEETRRLIQDLRPTALDDLGLVAALRAYAEERLSPGGVEVRFSVEGPVERLPSEVETTLFRIVQEATNNCLRHARARSLRIRLGRTNGRVVGEVVDDGVGFDMDAVLNSRTALPLGLLGMQERAALVGGELTIWSRPGQGTRIRLELPVPEGRP